MRKILIIFLMFFSYYLSYGQSLPVSVRGTVKDSDNISIPGVTVVLKGTNTGTITDINGNYSIRGIKSTDILIFSFIGYKTQEIQIGSRPAIDVVMVSDVVSMDEVVVVGYGVQKKESSVAAISQVGGETLKKASTISLSNALTGQVQGVFTVRYNHRC